MRNLDKIADVVTTTLAKGFDNVRITDVKVSKERDSDGDDVLRISVIFEGKPKDKDVKQFASAVRTVRPKLAELDEMAFPLFSFIAKDDLRGSSGREAR